MASHKHDDYKFDYVSFQELIWVMLYCSLLHGYHRTHSRACSSYTDHLQLVNNETIRSVGMHMATNSLPNVKLSTILTLKIPYNQISVDKNEDSYLRSLD